jgi:hypothetical protein
MQIEAARTLGTLELEHELQARLHPPRDAAVRNEGNTTATSYVWVICANLTS